MAQTMKVYVELLDEGSPTLRPALATAAENNLYQLIADEDYDPEDEAWDFLPGSLVRLEEKPLHGGGNGWIAKHPNPDAVRVYVESEEKFAPPWRDTYAIPAGNGLYEVLATPHYSESQLWKFPPGSIVRLKSTETSYPGWTPLTVVAP